jgi:hypothetical protein
MVIPSYLHFVRLGNAGGKSFRIYSTTGTVLATNSKSITTVSGGPQYVGSSTTTYQTIFLHTNTGEEITISFKDFEFTCREGSSLTVLYIHTSGRLLPFCGYNHQTHQTEIHRGSIRQALFPKRTMRICQFGAACIPLSVGFKEGGETLLGTIVGAPIIFFVSWLVFWVPLWFVSLFRSWFMPSKANLERLTRDNSD